MNKAAGSSGAAPTGERLAAGRKVGVLRGGRWLIRNVDISIHRGEIVTLIGPNGGGKSTTAKALLGLLKVNEGAIERAAGLRTGYVPQRMAVDRTLPLSVARMMTLTARHSAAEIASALALVGIEHLSDAPVQTLSGGEFQRALLARA
ncbi:MAG: ATP-binding cassette domain-containing protein, partial [Hyphomicrobiales bacterium]|nr:ATP-binding cassette domain-containing protein [Hyphomicrobiales bacterium]